MKKLLGLGVLVAAALLAGLYFIQGWNGAGPARRPTVVVIEPGSSLVGAAKTLETAGAVRSAGQFLFQAKMFGGSASIKAGEYEVAAGASHARILALLQDGRTLQRLVVIPEGLPSVLVHERLMRVPALGGTVAVPEEGSVLPDSYSFQRGESRAAVMKRMQDAMTKTLDALWAGARQGSRSLRSERRSSSPRSSKRRPARRPSAGWWPGSIRTGCGRG